jgi:amidase
MSSASATAWALVPTAGEDVWMPAMGVTGAMGAVLRTWRCCFPPRPLRLAFAMSLDGAGSRFLAPLEASFKGKRIGWLNDLDGAAPYEAGVLDVCRQALKTFETLGCTVETVAPKASVEQAWQAFVTLRQFQQGPNFRIFYADPAKRALLKPEALYEIEGAMKLSALDVTNATIARTRWSNAFHSLFEHYDFLLHAHGPGSSLRTQGDMAAPDRGQVPCGPITNGWWRFAWSTLSGCPSLAVPAGSSPSACRWDCRSSPRCITTWIGLKLGHAY